MTVFIFVCQKIEVFARQHVDGDADEFFNDVQRQYIRRQCLATDFVPYINRSDKPVDLCVWFSRTTFCTSFLLPNSSINHPRIQVCHEILDLDGQYSIFDDALSHNMHQLLSNSASTHRSRPWRASPLLNVAIGGSILISKYIVLPTIALVIFRAYQSNNFDEFLKRSKWLTRVPLPNGCIESVFHWIHSTKKWPSSRLIVWVLEKLKFIPDFVGWMQMIVDPLRDKALHIQQRAKSTLLVSRILDLWHSLNGDLMQELNAKRLHNSRAEFVKGFLAAADADHFKSSEAVSETTVETLFKKTKFSLEKWLKGPIEESEDVLFKNLDQVWSVWADTAAGQFSAFNAMEWMKLNFQYILLAKDEVHLRSSYFCAIVSLFVFLCDCLTLQRRPLSNCPHSKGSWTMF
jgi:hypothetical protein